VTEAEIERKRREHCFGQIVPKAMNAKLCLTGAALLAAIMGCGDPRNAAHEPATTSPPSASGAPTTMTTPAPAANDTSAEAPAETAAAAAAAAPECKDLEKAAPGTCDPEATGDPKAK
jgi:hypothetical protein